MSDEPPDRILGFPVKVSDEVPEDEVWVMGRWEDVTFAAVTVRGPDGREVTRVAVRPRTVLKAEPEDEPERGGGDR